MNNVVSIKNWGGYLREIIEKHKGKKFPKTYFSIELVHSDSNLFSDDKELEVFEHENIFHEGLWEMKDQPNYFFKKSDANKALAAISKALNYKPKK